MSEQNVLKTGGHYIVVDESGSLLAVMVEQPEGTMIKWDKASPLLVKQLNDLVSDVERNLGQVDPGDSELVRNVANNMGPTRSSQGFRSLKKTDEKKSDSQKRAESKIEEDAKSDPSDGRRNSPSGGDAARRGDKRLSEDARAKIAKSSNSKRANDVLAEEDELD